MLISGIFFSCGWNEKALWDHFLHRLAENVKDEIYSLELPVGLDKLVDLAIRVDDRIALRSRHRRGGFPRERAMGAESVATSDTRFQCFVLPEEEPMQIGGARLTAGEQRRRLANQLCLYCGGAGHVAAACPVVGHSSRSPLKGEHMVSITSTRLPSGGWAEFLASVRVGGAAFRISTLIDSGAEGDFMDFGLATRLGISSVALTEPISAKTLCGTLLTKITRVTQCVTLILSGNHAEEIQFFLIHSPSAPVVLGHTWLVKHNPHIDWAHKSILAWSPFCLAQCLGAAFSPVVSCSVLQEKYQFHARSVPFLGFILSPDGIRMDPTKVKAVADWPTPDSRRAVQRFLGFANLYRRFIRNFSQVALPLTDLTSTKKQFCWSSQAQTAFESLKSRFISAPILNTPDPSRQFGSSEVDASVVGVGAILSQRSSSDERIHPCAFFLIV